MDFGAGMSIGDVNFTVSVGLNNNTKGFGTGVKGAEVRKSIMAPHIPINPDKKASFYFNYSNYSKYTFY